MHTNVPIIRNRGIQFGSDNLWDKFWNFSKKPIDAITAEHDIDIWGIKLTRDRKNFASSDGNAVSSDSGMTPYLVAGGIGLAALLLLK